MESKCTGDCIKCHFNQQVYCAAQHAHAIMDALPSVFERLDRLESHFGAIPIINPIKGEAQHDSGAENRESETK